MNVGNRECAWAKVERVQMRRRVQAEPNPVLATTCPVDRARLNALRHILHACAADISLNPVAALSSCRNQHAHEACDAEGSCTRAWQREVRAAWLEAAPSQELASSQAAWV
eukprot:4325551-Pleurochrysis_carterae.AAC.4